MEEQRREGSYRYWVVSLQYQRHRRESYTLRSNPQTHSVQMRSEARKNRIEKRREEASDLYQFEMLHNLLDEFHMLGTRDDNPIGGVRMRREEKTKMRREEK